MLKVYGKLSVYFWRLFDVVVAIYTNKHWMQHCFADNLVDRKLDIFEYIVIDYVWCFYFFLSIKSK